MPIIGFANGSPVYDSADEDDVIETRAIVHDPHSGQFTSGGSGAAKINASSALHHATNAEKSLKALKASNQSSDGLAVLKAAHMAKEHATLAGKHAPDSEHHKQAKEHAAKAERHRQEAMKHMGY